MTLEYLIRPDDDWFNLHKDDFSHALRPLTYRSETITGWGDHRIKVEGIEIAFSFEDPGIQISFAGEINGEIADQIVDEILKNIEVTTGQSGRVILLS
ncbi:MAG: hypothetical protein IT327_00790 [Anaerolineae bacterium]|nr:hypothetical protein [Anaerolineae bacterium]